MKKYLIFICIVSIIYYYCIIYKNITKENFLNIKFNSNHNENLIIAQKKMTNMFYEFNRICDKYNLNYWCIGGTFVGTIRHNGWVPWDGDIDVGMLHDDYKKFKEYAKSELPKTMALFDSSINGLSRIRDLYSQYIDSLDDINHQGLQIDIFLYDIKYENNKKVVKFIGSNDFMESYKENVFDYDDVFPLVKGTFENIQVNIFNKYKKLSKHIFGDYPPPMPNEEKRYTHEGNIDPINPAPYYFTKFKELYSK
jgi:phosphorylcholine metabolism protein LicD